MRGKVFHVGRGADRSLAMFWLFVGGVLWRISSAQTPGLITLPTEMQGRLTIPEMRTHFCQGFDTQPTEAMPKRDDPFCLQISRTDNAAWNRQCWSILGNGYIDIDRPNCKVRQGLYCKYRDAVVCRYTSPDRMTSTLSSCVYHSGTDEPFCICENDEGMWPTTGHESSCGESSTPPSTSAQPPTTTSATLGAKPSGGGSGLEEDPNVKVVAIVLGCISSLLLLVIIIGIMYLRRRGQLPSFLRKDSNHGDSSKDVPGVNVSDSRAAMPDLRVLGDDTIEYAYAGDHRPQEPTKLDTRGPSYVNENVKIPKTKRDEEHEMYCDVKDGPEFSGDDSVEYAYACDNRPRGPNYVNQNENIPQTKGVSDTRAAMPKPLVLGDDTIEYAYACDHRPQGPAMLDTRGPNYVNQNVKIPTTKRDEE